MKSAAPERIDRAVTDGAGYGAFGAEFRLSPVEDTVDAELRHLLGTWNELRGERDMPARDELSPRTLAPMLRIIQMFEIVDSGRDFRCRVYGSGLTEQTGLQVTGRCMSEFEDPRLRERMTAALRQTVDTQAPVRMWVERSALSHLTHKQVETIWLPLGGREGVTHILSGVSFKTRAA